MIEFGIAVGSLVLGAFIQYIFTRLSQKQENKNKMLLESCIDYLESIAEVKFSKNEEVEHSIAKYVKAKERIILLGPLRLIDFLYDFEATNKIFNNAETKTIFIKLVEEMRVTIFNGSTLANHKMIKILFDD